MIGSGAKRFARSGALPSIFIATTYSRICTPMPNLIISSGQVQSPANDIKGI